MATTVWRGHLVFGLVSFPVRLYRAARAEKVSLRRLYRPAEEEPEPASLPTPIHPASTQPTPTQPAPEAGPIRRPMETKVEAPRTEQEARPTPVFQTHNKITAGAEADEPIAREALVKGYEFDKGQYVVLEDDELKSITPQTSKEMQIVEFVRLAEIDPIFFETSYYLAADEAGERPYALLQEALKQTGYVGLAQLAMHRREHVVIIRPGSSGMVAHTMFYPDEVRRDQEYRADTSPLVARELDLAKRLIETMVVPFEPEKFRDTYRERLQEMIASKVEGHRVAREPAAQKKSAAVIDIMKALQESLNQVKKPPTAEPTARKGRVKRAG
jgi:DNA end-binding protein Ku